MTTQTDTAAVQTSPANLRALIDLHNETFRQLRAVGADAMLAFLNAEIFDKYPSIKSLEWTQYSPYFNDGDPCTFSTHMWDACRGRVRPEEDPDCLDWVAGGSPPKLDDTEDNWVDVPDEDDRAGRAVLNSIPDYLYESLFGDGYRVFVWRGGIATSEYSHD